MPDSDHDAFLNPVLRTDTLDSFLARSAIVGGLRSHLQQFSGTLLDIGCGYMPYRSLLIAPPARVQKYIGLDLPGNVYRPPDLEWDGRHIPLEVASVDCALATELLEHCPHPAEVLAEAWRVLKPGGFLFWSVPFLWPLHCLPYDEHRYTPFAMERLLRAAGFDDLEVRASGGWDASLAQMIGLWVRRRPMRARLRVLLSRLALPLVRRLLDKDVPPLDYGARTMMIPALWGTARKPIGAQKLAPSDGSS